MNRKSIIAIVGAVAVINLLSRLLGFVREMIIGYHFGTSFKADSIIAAYTIPNFLYIAAGGALTTAFISLYSKAPGPAQKELKNVIFTYTFVVFGAISLSFLAAPALWINLFFHDLTPGEAGDTKVLFQFTGVSTVFLVTSMIFSGLLNLHDRFRASALAPLINNLVYVGLALALFPIFGVQAYSMGAFVGSILMLVPLLREMKKYGLTGFRFQFKMTEGHYLTRYLKVMFPILLGGATLQFYFLIHRLFSSQLQEGLMASLNYASKLVQLPQTILMTAVTTVIYPLIAKTIANNDNRKLSKMYNDGMKYLLFLMIPISIIVYLYATELISIVFQYGSFQSDATLQTSSLLKIFVIGMFAHAANVYVTRFYYAKERAIIPVISGAIAVFGVNILIVLAFIHRYGGDAIAWATTISAYFQLGFLLVCAPKRLGIHLTEGGLYIKLLLIGGVSLLAGLMVKWTLNGRVDNSILSIILGSLAIGFVYVLLSYLLKIDIIRNFKIKKGKMGES
ncbi:murein biosynthesis integral membrane protein MurJ [Falsibacillus pallidus]|uniref:murein biosynthesis integral membrane protein MurJ n=1 Tax=Falsibacillus pallidus TaxID=493781 RepID=UPI003D98F827